MENKARKVLIADDEPDIRELLHYNLAADGYEVVLAKDGDDALEKAKKNKPDLILLDVMMPKKSGVEVCQLLRSQKQFSDTLIVMLTALSDDGSVIKGLETGADDYIGKPISPKVLLSRLQALFRRQNKASDSPLEIGTIRIDPEKYLVTVDNKTVTLAKKEFELLLLLAQKPERVFLRNEILTQIWGNEVIVGDRTIDVHIRKIRQHRDANIKAIFAYSVFFPVVEIVLALSIGLVVWYTAKEALALQQSQQGTVIAFILCLNLLFRPLRVLADKFNVLQMGVIASERVFNVLDNPAAIPPFTNQPATGLRFSGKIEFDQVHFAYDPAVPVLKGISFIAQPGETIALVGSTGSGKTSITSLLTRLYEFQQGQIKIDDLPIQSYELETLRGQVGVVLQDVFLFSGSVYDNITLRNTSISKDRVEEAARMIGLHDFICSLPGGYDYDVRERGLTLSLGQRQLLSFIRALLYNPSILILDEATSSIDSESEQLIQRAIETLVQGRTSIVVAHRLSTIRKANKIIVLEKGEILEMGTHAELMAKNGHYAQLCKAQFPETLGS